MPQDEVDEIEVYGSEAQSGTQLATYSFEVNSGLTVWGGSLPVSPPDFLCVPRCATASSTLGPVQMLPWASLPSSLKRCLGSGWQTLLCTVRVARSPRWDWASRLPCSVSEQP